MIGARADKHAFSSFGSLKFDIHGRVIFFDALEWQLRNKPKTLTNLFYFSNCAAAYYFCPLMATAAPMTSAVMPFYLTAASSFIMSIVKFTGAFARRTAVVRIYLMEDRRTIRFLLANGVQ